MKCAAISLIRNRNNEYLCVWNLRYGGWMFPGGKVEDGETPEEAQARELLEETGLKTVSASLVYEGPHGLKVESTRGSIVKIYHVRYFGLPKAVEVNCPITWLSKEEFLKVSPASEFYERIFPILESKLKDSEVL